MHAKFACLGKERIVNIGDVADTTHGMTPVDESSLHDVVGEERRRMTEMGRVIGGDATDVHRHLFSGLEGNDGAAGSVVQAQRGRFRHRRSR